MIIGILEPKDFSPKALTELSAVGEVRMRGQEPLSEFLHDLEALFVRLGTYIGAELLEAAPQLKYICSPTTGANHIDLSELAVRDIDYLSLKGETEFLADIRATPEHTFGLILSLLRNYKALYSQPQHAWDRDAYRGGEIYGSRVGIIGLGRVGTRLAHYFQPFGAKIGYHDIHEVIAPYEDMTVYTGLEELLQEADLVLLCASYTDGQTPILEARHLDMLKGKFLINTSRGELIEESALYERAASGHFAGLALDVLAGETLPENRISDWADLAANSTHIILTPHVAGATLSSMQRTEEFIANKLIQTLGHSEAVSLTDSSQHNRLL